MRGLRLRYFLLGAFVVVLGFWGAAVTVTHEFQAGETIRASEVNRNFADLVNAVTPLEAFHQQMVGTPCGAGEAVNAVAADGRLSCVAAGGGTGLVQVERDATLTGNGTLADPLGVALPLELSVALNNPILRVTNTGANAAAEFKIENIANFNTALFASTNGTGDAFFARTFGTGRGGLFRVDNNGNTSNALEAVHTGQGNAGLFEVTNSGNSSPALEARSAGSGAALAVTNTGTGFGATISVTDPSNLLPALSLTNRNANSSTLLVSNQGGGSAGFFVGGVVVDGNLSVTGTKNFRIDHPLDPKRKYLYHAAIEAPQRLNVYSGNVTLDARGEAVVTLPAYFEALNTEYRYQLTTVGGFAPVYVAEEVTENRFKIAGGTPGLKVSWQVTGVRRAAEPFTVEEWKPGVEAGPGR